MAAPIVAPLSAVMRCLAAPPPPHPGGGGGGGPRSDLLYPGNCSVFSFFSVREGGFIGWTSSDEFHGKGKKDTLIIKNKKTEQVFETPDTRQKKSPDAFDLG